MSARLLAASDAVIRARAALGERETAQTAAFDAWDAINDPHDPTWRTREFEYADAKRATTDAALRLQVCFASYFALVEREHGRDPDRAPEDERPLRPDRPSGHVMTNE